MNQLKGHSVLYATTVRKFAKMVQCENFFLIWIGIGATYSKKVIEQDRSINRVVAGLLEYANEINEFFKADFFKTHLKHLFVEIEV